MYTALPIVGAMPRRDQTSAKMLQTKHSGDTWPQQTKEFKRLAGELEKRNMFEDGMNLFQMKKIYAVIVESEKGIVKDRNMEENKTLEPVSAVTQLSYARTASAGLPMEERKSSSPELSSGCQNKRFSQDKSMDSSDECMNSTRTPNSSQMETRDERNCNKSKSRSPNNIASNPEGTNNKRTNQMQNTNTWQEDKWPKFKINPFNFVDHPKDSRLNSYHRFTGDQDISGGSSDNIKKAVLTQMYSHLRNISEICHVQRMSSAETCSQWGTAVKVSDRERSTDKNIISDAETLEFDDDKKQPEASTSSGVIDDTKRRRNIFTNKTSVYNYGGDSDDQQDNSDDDFESAMKRRKRVASSVRKKASSTKTKKRESAEPVSRSRTARNPSVEKKITDYVTNIDDSDQCASTDDEIKDEPPKKVRRSKSEESEAVYPRRIVPPKPGPKWINLRASRPLHPSTNESSARHQTNDENEANASARQKKRVGLDEEDIAEALEKDNDDDDDHNSRVTKVDVDTATIRPLRISSRMKMQSQRLVELQEKEKEKEKIRRDQERIKEEMIRREKVERVQQRIREENEKQRMEEELEKQKAARENEWRNFVAQGNKKRTDERTDLHPDGRPQNTEIIRDVRENHSITQIESDDERINENGPGTGSSSDRVRCPICNRAFTVDEIEAHAGACEEFDECPPGVSRSSSPTLTPTKKTRSNVQRSSSSKLFECEVCEDFATNNGKQFENHISDCLRRKKYGESFIPDSIVEVPTSPIRTLRTISEQTDSEINYRSQFVPKTKSNKTGGKKRKR